MKNCGICQRTKPINQEKLGFMGKRIIEEPRTVVMAADSTGSFPLNKKGRSSTTLDLRLGYSQQFLLYQLYLYLYVSFWATTLVPPLFLFLQYFRIQKTDEGYCVRKSRH